MIPISLTVPQFEGTIAPILDTARLVESAGLAGVLCFDHLIPVGAPDRPVLEAASVLGAMSAVTSSITVGTMVLRTPLRGPGLTAAIAGTAGLIAPGRTVIGLGVGDRMSRPEAVRFGLSVPSLDDRLMGLTRTIDLIRSSGSGSVWVGGRHPRVRQIALAEADGWNWWGGAAEDVGRSFGGIHRDDFVLSWGGTVVLAPDKAAPGRRGVDPRSADGALVGTPSEVASALNRILRAGADHLVLSLLPREVETIELFVDAVVPALRFG